MHRVTITFVVFGAGAVGAPIAALAQAPAEVYQRPLDPGFEDVSPLGTSLILQQIDLRAVRTFDDVYRVPGHSGLLMRQSGALSAVFGRSDYIATDEEVFPSIPAGTIFYIGGAPSMPGAALMPPGSGPGPIGAGATELVTTEVPTFPQGVPVNPALRVRARMADDAVELQGDEPGVTTTREARMMTISDEPYRRRRLEAIARRLGSS